MKKLFTLAIMACTLVLLSSAQIEAQRTVTGVVTDSGGEALIGANILEKGTSSGTITDIDGSYSVSVSDGATLVFTYTGFTDQEIVVNGQSTINVILQEGELLDEVVVTGYGTQSKKEITSAVVVLDNKEFNQGAISDPAQLLQGKVAGLQVYNRGGDPNQSAVIRLRGISTVGANTEPLVVIDGIVGASLDNVDPNDIQSVNVLKDGSAAAIYGSRGSSGVIIVTTKRGSSASGKVNLSYNGQVSTSSPVQGIDVMSAPEFIAAGGLDLGSNTDWLGEVTRTGLSHLHSLAASGGQGNTSFRISANLRNVEGILKKSGFDQFNTRLNLTTYTLNDKLKIDFNSSLTRREQENGFNESLRYAVVANPSAPILGKDSPFPFAADQYGGYFELLGLFDFFNPVAIIEQNTNTGSRTEFNYGANFDYSITDNLTASFRVAEQNSKFGNKAYYPTTSNFRGGASSPIRKGLANLYNETASFKLYEAFGKYSGSFGGTDLTFTGGYSFQQNNFESSFFSIGDFPNNDLEFINAIENSQDLLNAGLIGASSDAAPDEKIIAFFGRVNLTFGGIFVNASLRREGSTKLGPDNKWGTFPAFGVGVDLNKYLNTNADNFKLRIGYGVTGALPQQSGLAKPARSLVYDGGTGGAATTLTRAANRDLKWEEKAETNLGIEYASGRFSATVDLYNRDIKDFILERTVDVAQFAVDRRIENAGSLNTKGIEVALNYDVIDNGNVTYNTGVVLSSYKSTLEEYVVPAESRGQLGAPGQNSTNMILVKVGGEIGTMWGPVYTGVDSEGNPIFQDVNGDGNLVTGQDNALDDNVDFAELGNGIPDLEIGWTNQVTIGDWSINAFVRGAFGHSLINTFRAFYEPRLASQSSYNFMNTSLAVPALTTARFSSLYVEKADFVKLDNVSISRSFNLNGNTFDSARLTFTAQNPLVITSYTGTDPEPNLVDTGAADNGGDDVNFADVLAPGIDRRNNYFSARSFTFSVQLNF